MYIHVYIQIYICTHIYRIYTDVYIYVYVYIQCFSGTYNNDGFGLTRKLVSCPGHHGVPGH